MPVQAVTEAHFWELTMAQLCLLESRRTMADVPRSSASAVALPTSGGRRSYRHVSQLHKRWAAKANRATLPILVSNCSAKESVFLSFWQL